MKNEGNVINGIMQSGLNGMSNSHVINGVVNNG